MSRRTTQPNISVSPGESLRSWKAASRSSVDCSAAFSRLGCTSDEPVSSLPGSPISSRRPSRLAPIGRMPCGLDGMDYGTPTSLPWNVVYDNPASYAPNDGVPRHPDQVYELVGDFLIAAVLIRLRPRLPQRRHLLAVSRPVRCIL